MSRADRQQLFLLLFITLLSRLPLIFSGYGAEEDAWALPLVASRIAETGKYEMSRLPGHPVQELVFALIADKGSNAFNLCTLLLSSLGILFFALSLHKAGVKNWWWAAFMLAFTPIFYINSSNSMDYTWSLAFMLGALYFTLRQQGIAAGLLLALAAGSRITSLAFLLPLLILSFKAHGLQSGKSMWQLCVATLAGALVVFSPVYYTYGTSFFSYYEHFPMPGLLKNSYKGTVAVWGLPGLIVLTAGAVTFLRRGFMLSGDDKHMQRGMLLCALWSIALFTIAFCKLPLKAAFMMPVVPFVIMLLQRIFSPQGFRLAALTMLSSCFIFGVNLAEAGRGSGSSRLALRFQAGDSEVALDPIRGLVLADYTKRMNRSRYADRVIAACTKIQEPVTLICGWWQAELLVRAKAHALPLVELAHYLNRDELRTRQESGRQVFYLEEQWKYNDQRFNGQFTRENARAFRMD